MKEKQQDHLLSYKKWILTGILVCVLIVTGMPYAAFAQSQTSHEVVRVGFFAFDGYHMEDEEGNQDAKPDFRVYELQS